MNNFYDKDEVLKSAEGMWTSILSQLGGLDSKYLNHNKHCDCPLGCIGGSSSQPGGKDRYRWINKPDGHSICNVCGSRDGFNLYLAVTGHDFVDALTDIGNYLNMIPVEKREIVKREVYISSTFPDYYQFDFKQYEELKSMAGVKLSPWQRVNGLNMIDILSSGDNALIPLLDTNQNACDFVMIDVDGDWKTTGGNKCVPSGFYSAFGDRVGKRTYIAVNAYHAAHASIFMQCQVVCCYEVENMESVANNFDGEVMIVVAGMDDVEQADACRFSQLTFNAQNKSVGRTVYAPFEIVDRKKQSTTPNQ